jgi:hypothetical protein
MITGTAALMTPLLDQLIVPGARLAMLFDAIVAVRPMPSAESSIVKVL